MQMAKLATLHSLEWTSPKGGMKFSDPDPEEFTITPLGAAIVEAMPDQAKVKQINRRFKQQRECPISAIFNAKAIDTFYGGTIKAVAVQLTIRARSRV
jgi:hypothetical protein